MDKITDYDATVNGLQMENRGPVMRIATAVDASLAAIKLAIAARADLLIVYRGLFWSATYPWAQKICAFWLAPCSNDA